MADQNTTGKVVEFYGEILSPSELFAARSRSHKIPVKRPKDFFPNDSEQQRQQLQQCLEEHMTLVSEERVERLGNLVQALWIPNDKIVELQTPAGKFWQTMGFSANGKQCLHPEEALYLMECGNLQVFFQDLPLSIQEGYERFLSSATVTLEQYQVFGHLKRLGYVVNRFDPSSVPSPYERQLNLPLSQDKAERRLKRKRSPSPTPDKRDSESQGETSCSRMEADKRGSGEVDKDDSPIPTADLTPSAGPEVSEVQTSAQSDPATSPEDVRSRTWWGRDVPIDPDPQPGQSQASNSPRWDFRSIHFPDLGSRRSLPSSLASPDPSLLPGNLSLGPCDVTPWLQKLNLRQVKMSASEQRREQDRNKYRWDVNKDKGVRQCRNWAEYRELQERRRRRSLEERPAHLWEGTVTPLHDPSQYTSTGELLDKISLVKSSRLLDGASRLKESEEWKICFNVYLPDTVAEFKKSNPGKPYSRMCVCSFDSPVPDLQTVKVLASQSGDIPVTFAVVDHGDISFYNFKVFQLPTDINH